MSDERRPATAKYLGRDPLQEHHSGIPARDLSQEEVAGLTDDHYNIIVLSALYEVAPVAEAAPVPAVRPAVMRRPAVAPEEGTS